MKLQRILPTAALGALGIVMLPMTGVAAHGGGGGGGGRGGFGGGFGGGFSGARTGFAGGAAVGRVGGVGGVGRVGAVGAVGSVRDPAAVGERTWGGWGRRGCYGRGRVYYGGGFYDYGWPYYDYGWPYYSGYYPDSYYGEPAPSTVVYVHTGGLAVSVQRALRQDGYYHGRIDGAIGPESRAAIRAFQADHGLPVNGRIDNSLLRSLGM